MFVGLARNLYSINASSTFEKARMQATYSGDSHPPNEASVQSVLDTLAGNNAQTSAMFAFKVLVSKLETSESRKYWNYVIKNLVILDRAIDEGLFVNEISEIRNMDIENYYPDDYSFVVKKIDQLVKLYFKYIRMKAKLYKDPSAPLRTKKDKRKEYFERLQPQEILEENVDLDEVVNLAVEIFKTGSDGHLEYPVNQYVFLLILHTMLDILSVQYAAFIGLMENFFETELEVAQACLKEFKHFIKKTEELMTVTCEYEYIPGFQFSLAGLRNPTADNKLIRAMEEYIRLLQKKERRNPVNFSIAFNINPEDFNITKAPSDLASYAERIKLSIKPPSLDDSDASFDLSQIPGSELIDDERTGSRTSMMFRHSFHSGFRAPVVINHDEVEIGRKFGDQLLVPGGKPHKEKENKYENLSAAFIRLLKMDKPAKNTFQSHRNFFSGEYIKDIEKQYVNVYKKMEKPIIYDLKPLAQVLNNAQVVGRLGDAFTSDKDFDQSIFDNHQNTFSKP